ncbi:terminase [Geobacillus sp. 46C-IIa]|uniref:terminase large subunit n=1 Tax=Geobacillus sp. 46C-IIa TaxID=1963025 RepID=UPI0009BFB372|nr:terminase TerL endonuclease subunit [Geobacillus sp. 46C-IIa]OQP06837.1 terminase [Geobacillus sp. 46C-IIa]QNU27446.1 terminase large subunit [Geobacillus sp. 46C-IIa]
MSLKQWLIDYSHDVIDGRVIACQKHKWACMRFLRDIEREGTDAFPYIFDETKAMRFLKWMTLFKHTKGVLKGQHIRPHEIQVFVFGNIYGWVHKDTDYRRFKKGYWQVGRKNAKSQSLACVASYEAMAFGESMSEVYIGATKTEQARIVWKETEAMLAGCPELKGKYEVKYGAIHHPKSRSIIRPLSKEDRKTGDGLNPQCGIIDEYHAHETDEIYNIIDSGMIARAQPLLMIITTAGANLNNPCYRSEYQYVSKLLDPNSPVENDQYFAMVNELDKDEEGNLIDDIKDEKAWLKANPIAASYPEGVENIRAKLKEALEKPDKMDDFLTKNMNVWINKREQAYISAERWAACGAKNLPDISGLDAYVGVDLSATTDLTSVSIEIPLDDGKFIVLSHSFIPEEKLDERVKTDKMPFDQWVRQGWITATPGAVVDYTFVREYIKSIEPTYGVLVKEICYDKYNARHLMQELEADGFTTVEIPQGIRYLTEPTKNFRTKVFEKKIIHNQNPVLTWAVGNAVTRKDAQENIMLDKSKSTDRIDPLAALINAHARAMFANAESVDVSEFATDDFLDRLWG